MALAAQLFFEGLCPPRRTSRKDGKQLKLATSTLIVKNMVRRHYLVSGRVQGVGFRAFVHRRANDLGLKGVVRNLSDGRVEVYAQGALERVAELEASLATGPTHARVERVETNDVNTALGPERPSEHLKETFSVAEDGEEPWQYV